MTDGLASLQTALADRYRVEREVGAGGMATVYLAQDLKHHRKVALKVLRAEIAATLGAERFSREIEVAAQLQHPHILPLLDSGEADGFYYYVMPFVEGESLRDRLAHHGELPVHDAVKVLVEVVDALAHAHNHGVVHRDIKPDNVLLSGRHALVTDFGVAKAVSEATGAHTLTSVGIALGTPAYMAPEQAAADPNLDHRVDLYAVGVLGYELLTGRPPFSGLTPQETLAAHVTQAPEPVENRRPGISPALAGVVMKCLAKRAADRWQTADELLAQLEPLATPSGGMTPSTTRPVAAVSPMRPRLVVWGAVGGAIAILAVLGTLLLRTSAEVIGIGRATQVTLEPGLEIEPAISPDGNFVAYTAGPLAAARIYVRQPGGRAVALTPDTGPSQRRPVWSPDGTRLLFAQGFDLAVVPALGGTPRVLVRGSFAAAVTSAAWSSDGRRVAYVIGDSLWVKPLDGGAERVIAGHPDMFALAWSPDGRRLAVAGGNSLFSTGGVRWFSNIGPSEILTISVDRGTVVTVTDRASLNVSPVWGPDGRHLLFVSNRDGPRDIYAIPLGTSGEATGPAVRVTTGLNAHSIALSADGRRIGYSVYTSRANIWSLPYPTGPAISVAEARPVTSGNQTVETLSVSADGQWLYYDSDRAGNADIYRMSLPAGDAVQVTNDPANEWSAEESPDGRWIAFHSMHHGTRDIMVLPREGGAPERVTFDPGEERFPQWSPDGNSLCYWVAGSGDRNGVYVVTRDSTGHWGSPRRVSAIVNGAAWSPDGRWLVVSTRSSLRLVPTDSGSERELYRVPPGMIEATDAKWLPGGTSVLFKTYDRDGSAAFRLMSESGGKPRLLVRFDDPNRPSSRAEWATDGRRLYFTIDDRQSDIYVAELRGLP